jgi:hypothetical protein
MSSRPPQADDVPTRDEGAGMSRPVLFGIIGGLAWFVLGLLIGHYAW